MKIALAETDDEIARCSAVLAVLRTHVPTAEIVRRVNRQRAEGGYRIAYVEEAAAVQAVAGFRFSECLAWGRFMYVDDLVTREDARSHGIGSTLFDWLVAEARSAGCEQLHLDSGVQRYAAHRFYLRKRMAISSHHFALKL